MLDRLSPLLAGKLAFRLFCVTPSRKVRSDKERRVLAVAGRRMAEAEVGRLEIPGGTIAAYRFEPASLDGEMDGGMGGDANPAEISASPVLVVHGWASRSEHMLAIIDGLRQSGRPVVAIDLPGHGRSSGRTLTVPMGVQAVEAAWARFGPFETMIGHSFGGVVIVNAAQGSVRNIPAMRPEKLVLIAAPASIPKLFAAVGAFFGLSRLAQAAFEGEVERLTGRPIGSFDGVSQLADIGAPTLVVHAREDREVAFENAETYAAAGPHVTLSRADGLGHRRIIGAASVVSEIAAFAGETELALAG